MPRLVLAAALLLAAPATLAQAVTEPVVTVSAGVLRAVFQGTFVTPDGSTRDSDARTFYAASIGGEVPVHSLFGLVTASAGARLRAASGVFGGGLAPQSASLYARVGTEAVSGLLGLSVDLGDGLFNSGGSSGINSDGQTAILAQLSGGVPAGPVQVFAQIDGAFALPTSEEILVGGPDPDIGAQAYPVQVRTGHQGSAQVGASVPAGPLEVGLALVVAGRTEGSFRYTNGAPTLIDTDGEPIVFSQDNPVRLGYTSTVGLVPSVTYRSPVGRLALRLDGSFTGYYGTENTPLGFTLSNDDGLDAGPDVRPAVTFSASVGL